MLGLVSEPEPANQAAPAQERHRRERLGKGGGPRHEPAGATDGTSRPAGIISVGRGSGGGISQPDEEALQQREREQAQPQTSDEDDRQGGQDQATLMGWKREKTAGAAHNTTFISQPQVGQPGDRHNCGADGDGHRSSQEYRE